MNEPPSHPAQRESALARVLHALYGVYTIAVFLVFGVLALLAVSLIPGLGLSWRRALAHWFAAAFFKVSGLPLNVIGLEHLPTGPCVLVANHASYLDGIVLKAALPARFCFVIKKEIVRVPLAATLLRRIGSEFVDRFNRHAGAMDARRLMKAASAGQALVFFPEGTFHVEPGLSRFHSGAFATAMRADVPVVPTVIRGTRKVLRSDRLLPRRYPIEVRILPPVSLLDANGHRLTVENVRDQARQAILGQLDEPDLATKSNLAA
jgi:1-acyl-sn-glycerol-3-phosphate acyltransferase